MGIGQHRGQGVETADRDEGLLENLLEGSKVERRLWRQRGGHEGPHPLVPGHRDLVSAYEEGWEVDGAL